MKKIIFNPRRAGKNTMGLLNFIETSSKNDTQGIASPVLTQKLLDDLVKKLFYITSPDKQEITPHHFEQNGCINRLRELFGPPFNSEEIRTRHIPKPEIYRLSGFDVYTNKGIPEGQLWLLNCYGEVIKRIKIL